MSDNGEHWEETRPRRSFTPEFKSEIVDLFQRGDRSVGEIASDFDLTETSVREWAKRAGHDAGTVSDGGLTTNDRKDWRSCGGRTGGCVRTWFSELGYLVHPVRNAVMPGVGAGWLGCRGRQADGRAGRSGRACRWLR